MFTPKKSFSTATPVIANNLRNWSTEVTWRVVAALLESQNMLDKYARLIFVFFILSCSAVAQPNSSETPLQVIQKFWGLEVQGGRLTPDGRKGIAKFFEDRQPAGMRLLRFHVISNDWKMDENRSEAGLGRAVFYVAFTDYGEIRENLDFIRNPTHTADGVWIKETDARYVLVLTDRHWEFTNDGPREIRGEKEWLIRDGGHDVIVSLDTAIRYVSNVHKEANNAVVQKNAARTLVLLRRLKESERTTRR
jgi:hypothetical protein